MRPNVPDWSRSRVLVVGDIILDRFVQGAVRRISPEAPIPVVEVTGERHVLGGAANVANNIHALGGEAVLVGAVGEDGYGEAVRSLLTQSGLEDSGVLTLTGRPTTVKTRIIAQHQQVVRVDRETREAVSAGAWAELEGRVRALLPSCGALVVSDYTKGVFTPERLAFMGKVARSAGKPYVVDPKPAHFPYPGATVVTPNRHEAAGLYGRPFATVELVRVAADLFGRTDWDAILFTLGEEGMAVAERGGAMERIPARVREVYDVTGAGDTVVAGLSLALSAGIPLTEAAGIANAAAGVVVAKTGTAVCSAGELADALREGQ
jgi:D-beta-D-heptose 7-phosphate kinase/D-beta-D-heptose 1-phosphate adenosyltransferase